MRLLKLAGLIGVFMIGTSSFAARHAGSTSQSDCTAKTVGFFGEQPAKEAKRLADSLNRDRQEAPKTNRPTVAGSFSDVSS